MTSILNIPLISSSFSASSTVIPTIFGTLCPSVVSFLNPPEIKLNTRKIASIVPAKAPKRIAIRFFSVLVPAMLGFVLFSIFSIASFLFLTASLISFLLIYRVGSVSSFSESSSRIYSRSTSGFLRNFSKSSSISEADEYRLLILAHIAFMQISSRALGTSSRISLGARGTELRC